MSWYNRDGYDLQYDRISPCELSYPRGFKEEQPNDPDIVEITNLENAFGNLVRKRGSLLNEKSRNLKNTLVEAQFLFERLKALDPGLVLNISPDLFLEKAPGYRRDAFNECSVLQNRITEAMLYRETLWEKLERFLATKVQTFQGVMGGNQDTLLYRIQVNPSSHVWSLTRTSTKPSACQRHALGYLCSGWNYFGEITNAAIINHISGVEVPTPMISVQESPACLMAFLEKAILNSDEDATLVEVFSLQMLRHIGVSLIRSTDLCRDRKIPITNEKGHANYVTNTDWVIMHWIPKEAIMATMRVDEFLALARDRGVIDGK
jgi:hypothetical protein